MKGWSLMAERDRQFEQDVRRIVYAALADRQALAAALSEQQPMPVADGAAQQLDVSPPSSSSPMEVGVQGGSPAPTNIAPFTQPRAACPDIGHLDFEDLGFDDDTEILIGMIVAATTNPRPQVVQEALRLVLRDKVWELADDVGIALPSGQRIRRTERKEPSG
jgi:hypothetical protein